MHISLFLSFSLSLSLREGGLIPQLGEEILPKTKITLGILISCLPALESKWFFKKILIFKIIYFKTAKP